MADCKEEVRKELGKETLVRFCEDTPKECNVRVVDGGKNSKRFGEIGFSLERNCSGRECVLRGEIAVDRDKESNVIALIKDRCNVDDIHRHTERRGFISHIHVHCRDNDKNKMENIVKEL